MHIHILGIAGSMTAPLALALKKQGHQVTGSDQDQIYPPFSTQLKNALIPINKTEISNHIDLAIIGSSYKAFDRTRKEFVRIKQAKIPYISATKYIAKNIVKNNSIIIAGSYGKTTITAATAFCLTKHGLDPSFMFGGEAKNKLPSLHFATGNWSVVEGDESINGQDTMAKFLYYPVKYLIITSANWEHRDSYQSETENLKAFEKLIKKVPKDGLIVYNPRNKKLHQIIKSAQAPVVAYQAIKHPISLLGQYNRQNLGAVETLCQHLNLPTKTTIAALKDFKGIKRRLDILAQNQDYLFIDDFAQSPDRIATALKTIRSHFPNWNLKVFYESHASFMQNKDFVKKLAQAFKNITEVVIFKLKINPDPTQRITAADYLKHIPNSLYIPLTPDLLTHYQKTLKKGEILVHFSSGGIEGLNAFQKIINLKTRHV